MFIFKKNVTVPWIDLPFCTPITIWKLESNLIQVEHSSFLQQCRLRNVWSFSHEGKMKNCKNSQFNLSMRKPKRYKAQLRLKKDCGRNFRRRNFRRMFFFPRIFYRMKFSPYGIFAVLNFAVWIFRHTELPPYGLFAVMFKLRGLGCIQVSHNYIFHQQNNLIHLGIGWESEHIMY